MRKKMELVVIICAVALITAIVGRSMIRWLKIETMPAGYWAIGLESGKKNIFVAGSSLADDGIVWARISGAVSLSIEALEVARVSLLVDTYQTLVESRIIIGRRCWNFVLGGNTFGEIECRKALLSTQ